MKRLVLIGIFVAGLTVTGLGWPQSSSQDQSGQSLADIARKLKAQESKAPSNGKVFTNDDVPAAREAGGVTVTEGTSGSSAGESEASGPHGEKYFRKAYSKLMGKKEVDQRELDVLQKKLNQNDVQYYGDPQKAMEQQYSREDITKNQQAIGKKKQDLANDDQALLDLQDDLRRNSGDPSWLVGNPVSIEPDVPDTKPPSNDGDSKDKKKSRGYWQARFKSARAVVATANEAQKLVEDEITFLKQRQAQEPSADAQTEINAKLTDRNSELEKAIAITEKANQNLAQLQKEFDDSGAPADWSAPEE